MAPQSKSNEKYRNDEVEKEVENDERIGSGSTDLESKKLEYEHFSDDDPYGPARVTALRSETAELLEPLSLEADGFERATSKQLRNLQQDAMERAKWTKARQDGFTAVLRLGRKTPTRSERVL